MDQIVASIVPIIKAQVMTGFLACLALSGVSLALVKARAGRGAVRPIRPIQNNPSRRANGPQQFTRRSPGMDRRS